MQIEQLLDDALEPMKLALETIQTKLVSYWQPVLLKHRLKYMYTRLFLWGVSS